MGVNLLVFSRFFPEAHRRVCSDSLSSVYVLERSKAASKLMQFTHLEIVNMPAYSAAASTAEFVHVFGPGNACSDAVSRSNRALLFELCAQLGVAPVELSVPHEGHALLEKVVAYARVSNLLEPCRPEGARGTARGPRGHNPRAPPQSQHSIEASVAEVLHAGPRALCSGDPGHLSAGGRAAAKVLTASLTRRREAHGEPATQPLAYSTASALARPPRQESAPQILVQERLLPKFDEGPPAVPSRGALARASVFESSFVRRRSALSKPRFRQSEGVVEILSRSPSSGLKRAASAAAPTPQFRRSRVLSSPKASGENCPVPRRSTAIEEAVAARVADLASRLINDSSPEALTLDPAILTEMCADLYEDSAFSPAESTLGVDALSWRRWCEFCRLMGTPSVRPALAFTDPQFHDRETLLQREFVVYCASIIEPRSGSAEAAKPQSSMNMLLGVRRVLRNHLKIPMVIFPGVEAALKALVKRYVAEHGADALMPDRKEPLDRPLLDQFFSLPDGTRLGSQILDRSSILFKSFEALLLTGFAGAFRKAELCLPDGATLDERRLLRSSVSWIIRGAPVILPSESQLQSLVVGDFCVLKVPLAKNDPFGLHFRSLPVYLPVTTGTRDAARAIAQVILAVPIRPELLEKTALFCSDVSGTPLKHSQANRLFSSMASAALGDRAAARYSLHSLRIGAATALLAAGASGELIQAMCRWRSPKSVKIYARLGRSDYATWLLKAASVTTDSVTARNIPRIDYDGTVAWLMESIEVREAGAPEDE